MSISSISSVKDIVRFEGTDKKAFWRRFSLLLSISTVIATMGLLRDSGAVVIAAMLVAPLMTPILGIAAAMIMGWIQRLLTLLAIVLLAAAYCIVLSYLLMYLVHVPPEIRIPEQILSRTDPGVEDLIIALAAGTSGAYVQIHRSEITLLPGAAIGVSLVPPLAAAGALIYFGNLRGAEEAILLFGTNLSAIILSACCVYFLSGTYSSFITSRKRRTRFTIAVAVTVLAVASILAPLTSATYYRYSGARAEGELAVRIKEWAGPHSVELLRVAVNPRRQLADIWAVVDLPIEASARLAPVTDMLPEELSMRSFVETAKDVLGEEYTISIRYQTRIAGSLDLKTYSVGEAPPVDRSLDR